MMTEAEKSLPPVVSTALDSISITSPFFTNFSSDTPFFTPSLVPNGHGNNVRSLFPSQPEFAQGATSSGHGSGDSSPTSDKEEAGSEGISCGSGAAGEGLEDDEDEMPKNCRLCQKAFNQPKVLSCLHVFCQPCLEQLMKEKSEFQAEINIIQCPKCQQSTRIPDKGIAFLVPDFILVNQLELEAIEGESQLPCESCRYNRKAVARCLDCQCYVCNECVNAHDYMKCFENHKVVTFEDLKKSRVNDKAGSLTCMYHPNQSLKYFCKGCQIPICDDCYATQEHMITPHVCQPIANEETIEDQKEDVKDLIKRATQQAAGCNDAMETLTNLFQDLSSQCEQAKDQVGEVYQSLKSALDVWKEEKTKEIDVIRKQQDLGIMEVTNKFQKTVEDIEFAVKFTDRVVNEASDIELLSMKKVVGTRLLQLIDQVPKNTNEPRIDFESDIDEFNKYLKCFGKFNIKGIQNERGRSPYEEQAQSVGMLQMPNVTEATIMPPIVPSDPMGLSSVPPIEFPSLLPGPLPPVSTSQVGSGGISNYENVFLRRDNMTSAPGITGTRSSSESSNPITDAFSISPAIGIAPPLRMPSIEPLPLGASITSRGASPIDRTLGCPPSPAPNMNGGSQGLQNFDMNPHPGMQPPGMNRPPGQAGGNGAVGAGAVMQTPPYPRRQNIEGVHTKYRFGSLGSHQGQFSSPHGFCLGADEEIIIADTNNHRIQVFQKDGTFKFQFGNPGREEGQLWYPRKVTVLRHSNRFVICDRGNERSRMQIFTKTGHFVRKIAIRYIDIVAGVCSTPQDYIVAVDSVSPTVFCIKDTGELYHWFDCSEQMREPSDIAVLEKEYYICDFKGHCVCVFTQEGSFMRRIGNEQITSYPNGIDISDNCDIVVGDSHGNRFHIGVFRRDGTLIGEFECPNVKVSRCCGLKITSEGYVVTLAKNNHHVLVLNAMLLLQQH